LCLAPARVKRLRVGALISEPRSEAIGPFTTEAAALADARDEVLSGGQGEARVSDLLDHSRQALPTCPRASRRLAKLGCSAHVIAAMSGHATLHEVARYTAAAIRCGSLVKRWMRLTSLF
jgi:hypothetical protein